jgi:phosphotransferase system enzyme I (PtsI)
MLKGIAVSPGVAIARAYCVDQALALKEPRYLDAAAASGEVIRFDNACQAAGVELDAIVTRVRQQLGDEEASIFQAHRLLLRDPTLATKVKTAILTRQVDAPSALQELLDEYGSFFSKLQDEYLKDRMAEPVVLVAPELLPSQTLLLQKFNIVGIVTEAGGTTGHAAILARSLGIPSISGLRGLMQQVVTGDILAMDGRSGTVHPRPDFEIENAYRTLQREYVDLRNHMTENRDLEPVSLDGTTVELLANVNGAGDAETAARSGATGVGLYRTEYLFLTHPTVPNEEEQYAAYKAVIEAAPRRSVTIRTLDIGGDKLVPYFGHHREANPFMGWRSIRISVTYPEFFQTQLRAILRAAVHGEIKVLFPMISTIEEVRHIKQMVARTEAKLTQEGVPFAAHLPLGAMIEVPAAALAIDTILREVDFISIGSNDLTQYVMAADRDNPKVAHLCEPFNPPVLKLLAYVFKACRRHGKPVTLCGEMAGRAMCFLPLFGMGLRRFSMSPAFLPTIKELVRHSNLDDARRIARKALKLQTVDEVRRHLARSTRNVCPNALRLDTRK